MIYEERTYTLHPGTTPAFLKEYQEHGMRAHHRHLGEQVGFFTTDVGVLNQVVQIFAFPDAGDRQRRRDALYADPEWLAFVPVLTRYVQHMQNRLLTPTDFRLEAFAMPRCPPGGLHLRGFINFEFAKEHYPAFLKTISKGLSDGASPIERMSTTALKRRPKPSSACCAIVSRGVV